MTSTKSPRKLSQSTRTLPKTKPRVLQANPQTRLVMIGVFLLLCALGLIARLFFLQIYQHDELTARARQQQVRRIHTFAPRRTISDRHGTILAVDQAVYTVYAHPHLLEQSPTEIAEQIAPILQRPTEEIARLLSQPTTSVRLERWLSEEAADSIKKLRITGIDFIPQQKRIYPQQDLAAEIVGYVDIDHQGQAGLEKSLETTLKQPEYNIEVLQDGEGRLIPNEVPSNITQADTATLQLTIDARLQRTARQSLQQQIERFGALRGAAVVMDAHNGEILALATQPTYDPNRYFDYHKTPELFKNWAVTDLYEPGSTFKPINVAIALDAGVITPDTVLYDAGVLQIGDATISNFDGGSSGGSLSITDILATSSNIGMVQMMKLMPPKEYYQWLKKIGIDQKTGIDLPAEAIGQIKSEAEFMTYPIEPAAASFGQGLSLTVMKMVQLQGILANGGLMVTPHVVRGLVDETGNLTKVRDLPEPQRIFRQTTANRVVEMMTSVVEYGTGKSAKIKGYRYGGKTGTAQKAAVGGGYSNAKITSYVGIFPAQAPRYVAMAVIDEPVGSEALGSTVAAPVVKAILEELITIQAIPPTHPQELHQPTDATAEGM